MSKFDGEFWDSRYFSDEFVYGVKPNRFFKNELDKLKPSKILLLGEGEGRNAVYAASNRWEVDAVDFSNRAKEKAVSFAMENNVTINYDVMDLSEYKFKPSNYDVIAIIFLHLKPKLRRKVHPQIFNALISSGKLIMEVFEKDQLGRNSGGPQNIDMLYSEEELKKDFGNMNIESLEKKVINLEEGEHHKGEAVVLRLVALKN
jgi:SAM-dependent methyltransferase